MMKFWVCINLMAVTLMFGAGVVSAQDDLVVSNVNAVQRPGSALVDVTYDLATVDNLPATVTLWLSTDGGVTYPLPCVAVSGDVGEGILQGFGLHVVWDVSSDYPGFSSANCQIRVTADDGVVFEVPNTTTIIPEQDSVVIQAYSPDGAVTLDAASQYAQNIEVGDVLIGENDESAPDGLLRKVTSKTIAGNSVILETSPALMTEAFEMMALEETHRLRPSDVVSSKFLNGAELRPAKEEDLFNVALNCVLYDQDGDQGTTDDQIRINGEYKFTADIFTTIDISWFTLRKFEVGIETNETMDIGLDANLGWQFAIAREFDLAALRLGAIPLGGVVWLVPTLTVKAHVQGDLTVSFETGITCTQEIRNGFGYANSDYYLVNDSTRNFAYTPPTFEAEFDFETGASINASCLLYGVAGPYMGAKTGLHFESILHADPCTTELQFNLEAILDAVVGVGIDVWILDLDYNREYELYVEPIGEWVYPLGSTGTVVIDAEPDSLNAAWSIEGPCGYAESGNGDTTLTDLKPGDYTVTWGSVGGWVAPPVGTRTLLANEITTFSAVYVEDAGAPGFVLIPAGIFAMGSPTTEPWRYTDETEHQVTLTHRIYVQATEVTNQQYRDMAQWAFGRGYVTVTADSLRDNLDGSTQLLKKLGAEIYEITFSAGVFSCINPTHPVKYVTWYGSVAYCDWLSMQQGLPRAYDHSGTNWQCNGNNPYTAAGYRLPTEAEWEYVCRAGSTTALANGPCTQPFCDPIDLNLDVMGWYCGNDDVWTLPVSQKLPNAWGVYDMHGNLYEWCNDWYGPYGGTVTDPVGPVVVGGRVTRGGDWSALARYCRSASRWRIFPGSADHGFGFRSVRSVD